MGLLDFFKKPAPQTGFSGIISDPSVPYDSLLKQQSGGSGLLGNFVSGAMNLFGMGNKTASAVNTGFGIPRYKPMTVSNPYTGGAGLTGFQIPFTGGPGPRQPAAPASKGFGGSLMNMFKGAGDWMTGNKGLMGTALIGAGLLKRMPKAPQIPQSVEDLRSQLQSGGNPYAQDAAKYWNSQLMRGFDPLTDEEIQARVRQVEEQEQDEMDALYDAYKNIRPGADLENDSSLRRDFSDLHQKYARIKQDTIGLATRDIRNQLDAQQMQAASGLGSLGQADMQNLMQLAQLDVDQLALQLGIDLEQANFVKTTLANLGTAMIAPTFDPAQMMMLNWLSGMMGGK